MGPAGAGLTGPRGRASIWVLLLKVTRCITCTVAAQGKEIRPYKLVIKRGSYKLVKARRSGEITGVTVHSLTACESW
jgi:hypothetical protein